MIMTMESVLADMAKCEQFLGWSILDHGRDCANKLTELLTSTEHGQVLPDWYWEYRERLIAGTNLEEAYEYALMHDCGKPYCRIVDEDGKQHFPNHAEISYQTYLKISDNQRIADLIKHDMSIHLLKADGVQEFCKNPNAALHLLAGLAELISNAEHSGGFDSVNFKIKYKAICQRGKAICKTLFR